MNKSTEGWTTEICILETRNAQLEILSQSNKNNRNPKLVIFANIKPIL